MEQYGKLSPPYPDPERPGCYRLPLTGFDMKRQEAIIEADALRVVEGKSFYWSNTVAETAGTSTSTPQGRYFNSTALLN